ncbi:MAG: formate--tetrahydrofolate ligase [Oligoflexales bacterium]|nr:formate--tetrahydrofolate ligase [Oligoflexales bacterium]
MLSDIEIAQKSILQPIVKIAASLGLKEEQIESYGRYKAKVLLPELDHLPERQDSKLILVTAISPTPMGEGKTTTTIGLGDALRRIGKQTVICLREPSLGPVFGLKGGATGGGYAQVAPMEDINLHFTGDFNAIQLANNLLSSLIDNHIHHGNALKIDLRRITWKRVLDLNDRSLRELTIGLGGVGNGFPRQDGFDIVVASEVMAVLCLADSISDLKKRLSRIVVASNYDQKEVTAGDLDAHGSMAVLLKDAIHPNLVQTLEHTPAFIHGGPFANIAHGCNSVLATKTALKLADYVVTEAGFGADLGAEKFIDIKCRKANLNPSLAVVVASVRALKYHAGLELHQMSEENPKAVAEGLVNLQRHAQNIRDVYGLSCIVALNRFDSDHPSEISIIYEKMKALGIPVVEAQHWAKGSQGAESLARMVVDLVEKPKERSFKFVYDDALSLWDKAKAIAQRVYHASDISAPANVEAKIKKLQEAGYGHFPVCIAKTPYSFSADAKLRGAPSGHILPIREVRLAAGAEFVVMICGDVMTMPGLPKSPAAHKIDIDDHGKVLGLS